MSRNCPSCGETLKTGMISQNEMLSPQKMAVISAFHNAEVEAVCDKCGGSQYAESRNALTREAELLRRQLFAFLPKVPIVSLQSPAGWEYSPLGIVTAQSVTGTGIFSDVTSAFTDLFGAQSGACNAKIRDGENICKSTLRAQTLEMGGNAVLAVDVDYSEVGGQRAMLMVCMTGTAVEITETDSIQNDYVNEAATFVGATRRIRAIDTVLRASH
jgi:uncharacterized protein YbjQ (UPF0145 family)